MNLFGGLKRPNGEIVSFHFEAAKAFYDGYFSVTPYAEEEKERIFDGAVIMQLM